MFVYCVDIGLIGMSAYNIGIKQSGGSITYLWWLLFFFFYKAEVIII